ncbi:hypothetical protein FRX31_034449 [Thalictrum thalictroides]|uniref:Uncharacterized protein n=1 Tax=Thalictrum thalictroides TaxID=46969 RepID=A0A7J6UTN3_THATH|nr:hypothetical protein FRX31_034449 [Thalictrum thalictroides]
MASLRETVASQGRDLLYATDFIRGFIYFSLSASSGRIARKGGFLVTQAPHGLYIEQPIED